jgi:class 3 adenylate cyclase
MALSLDYRSKVSSKVLDFVLPAAWLVCRSEGAVTEQRVQRRLAAILAADVVGYSALMERNEEATYAEFERLKRELIEPSLARHEGLSRQRAMERTPSSPAP